MPDSEQSESGKLHSRNLLKPRLLCGVILVSGYEQTCQSPLLCQVPFDFDNLCRTDVLIIALFPPRDSSISSLSLSSRLQSYITPAAHTSTTSTSWAARFIENRTVVALESNLPVYSSVSLHSSPSLEPIGNSSDSHMPVTFATCAHVPMYDASSTTRTTPSTRQAICASKPGRLCPFCAATNSGVCWCEAMLVPPPPVLLKDSSIYSLLRLGG